MEKTQMEELLHKILKDCYPYTKKGRVATYIPELAKADTSEFGICTISPESGITGVGD